MDKKKQQIINSGLYLVSTPIGNMEDITFRAINILKKADTILCEDTRRSSKLLSFLNIKNKLSSYHKFNESKVSNKRIELIKKNKIIALISDAGTPTISDPGMVLVKKCIEEKLNIYPIPGPSAVTSAMSVSGFSDKYLFYGFLPKKENEIDNIFKNLIDLNYSLVFFIPGVKINFYIKKFKDHFFGRKIVIAKEMTKVYEEFTRNDLHLIKSFPNNLKGEITVILSEKSNKKIKEKEINEPAKIEIRKMLKKYSHKDVVEFMSKKENLSKKIIYNYCLNLKK